jgi:hypothetical protein
MQTKLIASIFSGILSMNGRLGVAVIAAIDERGGGESPCSMGLCWVFLYCKSICIALTDPGISGTRRNKFGVEPEPPDRRSLVILLK